LARKSRLNNKLFFILIATLLFSTIIYLRSLDTQNVRGNWAPVVLIYILTMIWILLRARKPEDHYTIRARKYSTPQARAAWYALQKERSKHPKQTSTPLRLATAPRLSVPFIFLAIPSIFSIILFVLMPEAEPPLTVPLIFSLILLALGLRSLHSKRIIDDTPTLKTKGVFIGLAELKGTAESENPLTSYITGTRCVQHSWSIEEYRTNASWATVDSGEESSTFYLKDDTGAIKIDPRNALLESDTTLNVTVDRSDPLYYDKGPPLGITESRHRRIFTETLIPLHSPLYVIGKARERHDRVAVELAYDEEEPLFVISTKGETQVSSRHRNQFLNLVAVGLIISILIPVSWAESPIRIVLIPSIIYVVASILGWSLVVHNSLVNLRNNVDQAWSTIDVQLKRRSDLIPNLVEIIEGYTEHEEKILVQTATLRAQTMNQETPIGVTSLIQSVAEAYPELKAGQHFLELQRTLEETEQRIALARDYYNQLVRFYNTRLEVIPDMVVARLGGLKPRSFWMAENFQRVQEKIDLVS